ESAGFSRQDGSSPLRTRGRTRVPNCGRILHVRTSPVRPFGLCVLLSLAGCAGFARAASGQDEPLQAFRGRDVLTLLPAAGGARIELPSGAALRVALPERAEVSAFAAVDSGNGGDGWVAAGSAPDP